MTGPALLLAAEHADPRVAAREARRRLGSAGREVVDEQIVAAVVAEGFSEQVASEAVAALREDEHGASTTSCSTTAKTAVSDD